MPSTTNEADLAKFNRLPRWAQSEILRLRRNYDWLVNEITKGPEKSDTFLSVLHETDKPLGEGVEVWVNLGDEAVDGPWHDHCLRMRVTDRPGHKVLEVIGIEALVMQPVSSNMVRIHTAAPRRTRSIAT